MPWVEHFGQWIWVDDPAPVAPEPVPEPAPAATYSPPHAQAPVDAYNYESTPSGSTNVYPPGEPAPAGHTQVSTIAPQADATQDHLLDGGARSGSDILGVHNADPGSVVPTLGTDSHADPHAAPEPAYHPDLGYHTDAAPAPHPAPVQEAEHPAVSLAPNPVVGHGGTVALPSPSGPYAGWIPPPPPRPAPPPRAPKPPPWKINARNYFRLTPYARDLLWADFENDGWDAGTARDLFLMSLPKYTGQPHGSVRQ